jgi:hypothetical protein
MGADAGNCEFPRIGRFGRTRTAFCKYEARAVGKARGPERGLLSSLIFSDNNITDACPIPFVVVGGGKRGRLQVAEYYRMRGESRPDKSRRRIPRV